METTKPPLFSSGKKWIFVQTGLNVVESLSKNISSTIQSSPKDSKDEKTQRKNLLLLKYNSTWPELHTQIRPNTWATWFFRMGEKNNMSQKFEKGPKWTWKVFHCYSIAFNHSKSAGKYYVLFREDFVSTWDVCFFGKPKAILVLLTTKARLRDCSNEVSCWKCSKDL